MTSATRRPRARHRSLLPLLVALVGVVVLFAAPGIANATRIKDLAYVEGVRDNQLIGYGLIVGLDNTGDYGDSEITMQSIVSMLSRMGIRVDANDVRTRNAAAVMVTATLPPFASSGQTLDVLVSSLGNARSIEGGTLLMTPLMGPDGAVYALAQGAVSVGGYSVSVGRANREEKNHVNAGRIPNGAIVEAGVTIDLSSLTEINVILDDSDFTTAVRVADAISTQFGGGQSGSADPTAPSNGIARALDGSTVVVEIPAPFQGEHVAQFVAAIETLDVQRDTVAKVIVNERTGTVVMGGNTTLGEVAVSHGSIEVRVSTGFDASQPNPLGEGETRVLPDTDIDVYEDRAQLMLLPESTTIGDVVSALNALGVTSRDLIAILQAIDAAGALNAKLEIQ